MTSPNVDLFKLFQIWNPSFRYNSCVGFAPSKGKRCGWEMYGSSVAQKLKVMGDKLPDVKPTTAELMSVATDALCHYHKGQASKIATQWKSLVDDIDLEDLSERMRNARMNDDDSPPRFRGRGNTGEEAKKKQEEKKKQERAQEEARKKREEEERKKKEEYAKEEARRWQEFKAREAETERRSWRQAWTRYAEGRDKFKNKKVYSSSGIPWPVKSGKRIDVTEQNVLAFYYNALPGSNASDFYKMMQQECLIWHPDKAKHLVVSCMLTATEEASMAIIARMVVRLHKEFGGRRAS